MLPPPPRSTLFPYTTLFRSSECETHKGYSMIHLDFIDRAHSVQTTPVVCLHCDSPTCAEVCPADAIKRSEEHTSELQSRRDLVCRLLLEKKKTTDKKNTLLH